MPAKEAKERDDVTGTAHYPIILRRIVVSSAIGLIAFGVSHLLRDQLDLGLRVQLALALVVGAVTLLSQLLADFSQRQTEFGHHLAQIERNSLTQFIEASPLQNDLLTDFIKSASKVNAMSPPLVLGMARYQVERVTQLLRSLGTGQELSYEGEDREWLLGLAHNVRHSIVATSLVSSDAHGESLEAGLWLNDLGTRYLEIQRGAQRRGVKIRRIFVFRPGFETDPGFVKVRQLQRAAGIEIRGLSRVPPHLNSHITDFVVFDDSLVYEIAPVGRNTEDGRSPILATRIVLSKSQVEGSTDRFEELWRAATLLPDDQDVPYSAGGVAPTT